jgi:hypothetical protein
LIELVEKPFEKYEGFKLKKKKTELVGCRFSSGAD